MLRQFSSRFVSIPYRFSSMMPASKLDNRTYCSFTDSSRTFRMMSCEDQTTGTRPMPGMLLRRTPAVGTFGATIDCFGVSLLELGAVPATGFGGDFELDATAGSATEDPSVRLFINDRLIRSTPVEGLYMTPFCVGFIRLILLAISAACWLFRMVVLDGVFALTEVVEVPSSSSSKQTTSSAGAAAFVTVAAGNDSRLAFTSGTASDPVDFRFVPTSFSNGTGWILSCLLSAIVFSTSLDSSFFGSCFRGCSAGGVTSLVVVASSSESSYSWWISESRFELSCGEPDGCSSTTSFFAASSSSSSITTQSSAAAAVVVTVATCVPGVSWKWKRSNSLDGLKNIFYTNMK